MTEMNNTLWVSFDLPGHLSKLVAPWLGTVQVEVVGKGGWPNSDIPITDFVATVKYNGTTHVTRKRASSCSDDMKKNCFDFGGWSGLNGSAQHSIEVVAPGYRDQIVSVRVRGNLNQRLTITMTQL